MTLACESIHHAYRPARPVLSDVSLRASPGEVLALIGPNGSGKSTLLRILAGSLTPTKGRVTLDSREVRDLGAHDRALRVAYVPQVPGVAFAFDVRTYVAFGRHALGRGGAAVYADEAMKRLDLLDQADEAVPELSAGQRQRAALARALCQLLGDRPAGCTRVLLADEPFSALDPRHALAAESLLRELAATGVAVVVVLHDLALAARLADRVALLGPGGNLAVSGAPGEVLREDVLAGVFGVGFERLESGGRLASLIPRAGGRGG